MRYVASMPAADFEPFFGATATVTGALVGLLFVARSVAPERTNAEERVIDDVRAGVAFSCLVNPLAISLVELARRPHDTDLERTVCVLIVVLFLIGIARAGQLIGARDTGPVVQPARIIGSHRRSAD